MAAGQRQQKSCQGKILKIVTQGQLPGLRSDKLLSRIWRVAWKLHGEGVEALALQGGGTLGLGVLQILCVYTLRMLHMVLIHLM